MKNMKLPFRIIKTSKLNAFKEDAEKYNRRFNLQKLTELIAMKESRLLDIKELEKRIEIKKRQFKGIVPPSKLGIRSKNEVHKIKSRLI